MIQVGGGIIFEELIIAMVAHCEWLCWNLHYSSTEKIAKYVFYKHVLKPNKFICYLITPNYLEKQ